MALVLGRTFLAILLAATQTVTACASTPAPSPDDPVLARGLQHSSEGRGLADEAIETANLLTSGAGPALASSLAATKVEGTVPVYLVKASGDALATPAAVPRGCACIFVNIPVFEAWIQRHSTGNGRLSLDARYLLAFMLLHEIGHLREKTSGVDFQDGELVQLNIDPSVAKAREEDADEFAAKFIREKARAATVSSTSLAANWVAMELVKLSWNMQAYRTLDEFGAFATGKPAVFFDQGYSHPNLAWRVLRSNFLIQNTPETKYLLEAFEEARQRGAKPKPLYQRQSP